MNAAVPHYFDIGEQPIGFPTQKYDSSHWEALGRAVGTFGYLEFVLGRSIVALTANTAIGTLDVEEATKHWSKTLEGSIADPLGGLIQRFEHAVQGHHQSVDGESELIADLRASKVVRDALCHGAWVGRSGDGQAAPWFVNRKLEILDTEIDLDFLSKTQLHIAELCCRVMNSVAQRGLQFPGTNGPGKPMLI